MTDSIADDLLRSGYDRWVRLEEEKAGVSEDLKALFAELKSAGFDTKALRASFRRVSKIGDAEQQEQEALVDLYVASLTRDPRVRAHRNIEQFPVDLGKTEGHSGTNSVVLPAADRATEATPPASVATQSVTTTEPAAGATPASGRPNSEPMTGEDTPEVVSTPASGVAIPTLGRDHCLNTAACAAMGKGHCHRCETAYLAKLDPVG